MTLPAQVRTFLAASLTPDALAWVESELRDADSAARFKRELAGQRAARTRLLRAAVKQVRAERRAQRRAARQKLDKPKQVL